MAFGIPAEDFHGGFCIPSDIERLVECVRLKDVLDVLKACLEEAKYEKCNITEMYHMMQSGVLSVPRFPG